MRRHAAVEEQRLVVRRLAALAEGADAVVMIKGEFAADMFGQPGQDGRFHRIIIDDGHASHESLIVSWGKSRRCDRDFERTITS
jgi:hypothetical protein